MKHFYLKQKVFSFADRYKVYNDQQQVVYYCKGKLFSLTHKMTFIQSSNESEIYHFQKKLFSLMPEYHMYDRNQQLVATVRKQFTLISKKVNVTGKGGNYHIEGNFYAHSFGVMDGQQEVASIRKKFFSWGDSYEISISDDSDEAYMIALVILVDSIFHNQSSRHSH